MIGTAAAFIIGFKNTQTYNRLWEARQIWVAMVNQSRTFGIMARDYVSYEAPASRQMIYRHIAWLTAVRLQLREHREWENYNRPHFREYRKRYVVPEWENKLDEALESFLDASDLASALSKKNRATQLIALQSEQLKSSRKKEKSADWNMLKSSMVSGLYTNNKANASGLKTSRIRGILQRS